MEKQLDLVDAVNAQTEGSDTLEGAAVYLPPKQPPAIISSPENNQILSIIERIALTPGADMAALEKMIDLQERILNKNAASVFAAAFAEMQIDLPEIVEKSAIRHGEGEKSKLISKYASFEDINEAVKPVLAKHGFGVSFRIDQSEGKIKVTGILSHKGGHSESTDMVLPADTGGAKNAVQAIGSSVHYGQRYVLRALLNISTRGADDDGNKAVSSSLTDFQKEALKTILADAGGQAQQWFAQTYGVIDDVPVKMFTTVETRLKNARDKHKEELKKEAPNATN